MVRTIDDFLDEVYRSYHRRWLSFDNLMLEAIEHETAAVGDSSSKDGDNASKNACHSPMQICRYRHYLPVPLLALCIANSSDATEILMLSYLLANPTFKRDMFGDDGASSSMEGAEYLAASIFMGMLIGGTIMGFLSDHVGRRPALLAGLSVNAVFGLLSSFPALTPTLERLTLWRFIAGIGVGATVPSLFSLTSEWAPKEVRGAVVTFVASFWMVGSLYVSCVAWALFQGDRDYLAVPRWRIFAAICAAPSAVGAYIVYSFVPESPRFLSASMKKYDRAAQNCNQMAEALLNIPLVALRQVGSILLDVSSQVDTIQPLAGDELREADASNISTGNAAHMTSKISKTIRSLLESLEKVYSRQLLSNTTLPLQTIWFCLSFGGYGITTWINTLFVSVHLEDIYFNSFLFALANLPGNILSVKYSDRWGRKQLLVGSLVGAALGLAAFALFIYGGNYQSNSKSKTFGIVLSACFFQIFSIVSWNAVNIVTGELFPTSVRSAGNGVCSACGRLGAMTAQFVNARLIGSDGGGSSVLVVAASTILAGAGVALSLRESKGTELRDEIDEPIARVGCLGKLKGQKEHVSDDEMETEFGVRNGGRNEYQSIQEGEVFLL